LYLVLYSAVRFFDDFLRDPSSRIRSADRQQCAVDFARLIALVVVIWLRSRRRVNRAGAYIKATG